MTNRPYYHTWNHQPEADPFPVRSAEHDEFVLQDGRRVYDFLSTSFQANFGHSHPAIQSAIANQLNEMPIASPKAAFALKHRVSQRFCEMIGLPCGIVFYTTSGSESVENALKMARQITGRNVIAARKRSYHGATLGALSVTGDWRNEPHLTLDEHTLRIPEPCEDPDASKTTTIVNEAGAENVAAMIVETISGANGVAIPTQAWFDGITALCESHGIMLICDEVLCGFGRTSARFAFQDFQLKPDFVCVSKGISGGYIPFGAVWTGTRVADYYSGEKMACGLTNYAHPLGLAALDAVMDVMADAEFGTNKKALESQFQKSLNDIANFDCVEAVRCRGLLAAIDLQFAAPTWESMFAHGIHAYSKQNMLVIAPPFISKPSRLTSAFETLATILQETKAS